MADETIDLDHHDPAWLVTRHDGYASLRERCPVVHNEHYGGYWLVTDHESVSTVARDNETFAHRYEPEPVDGIRYQGICGVPRMEGAPKQGVAEIDGAEHADLRRHLNPFFAPRHVAGLMPTMAATSTWFLDEIVEDGRGDLVLDYTTPVPGILTLEMMGMPTANWKHYADFFHASSSYDRGSPEFIAAVGNWEDMMTELLDFARFRRTNHADDITTMLVTSELDGRALTDEEVGRVMWNLIAGGLDTTTSLVGWGLHHLGTVTSDRKRLIDDPSLMPLAVEEFLRYYAPSETLTRTATRDVELGGRRIRRGDVVMISWVSANRDRSVFDEPDEIRIDRAPNNHVSFGLGGHRCVGSHLARAEAELMLNDVLARVPDYVIDEAAFRPNPPNIMMSGVASMPVTFTPGKRLGPIDPPF